MMINNNLLKMLKIEQPITFEGQRCVDEICKLEYLYEGVSKYA